MLGWHEVGDGVLVRRYAELDLTVGLVLGERYALVIDTRGDRAQGTEFAEAVRTVTDLPWQVAITHGHFDHCFGTEAFLPARVWAHDRCPGYLRTSAERQRTEWTEYYRDSPTAADLATTEVIIPDEPVRLDTSIDLGGRQARLRHLGPGHTDHDLVIAVPDAHVVFAGDLVEQGAPPDFADAHLAQWPSALDELLLLMPTTVVPGHGDPVGADFVRAQRAEIAQLAVLANAVESGSIDERAAWERSPYPTEATRAAFRAFRHS